MEITHHECIARDLKNLKRFPAPKESLEAWERLLCVKGLHETPSIDAFPGFGERKIYKGRIVPLRENVGKSKGYRVVFEEKEGECYEIIIFLRHGIYHDEQDLYNLVRERLSE